MATNKSFSRSVQTRILPVLLSAELWLVLAACLVVTGAWLLLESGVNHDVAWSLYVGKQMLAGDSLYTDLVEFNLPLVYQLSAVFYLLASVVGGFSPVAFLVISGVALLGLLWAAGRLLEDRGQRAFVCLAFLVLMIVPFKPSLDVVFDYFQREYLIAFLLLPYLFSSVDTQACKGRSAQIAVALTLAAAALLKPHYLAVPLLIEAYRLLRGQGLQGLFRPELLLAGAVFCLYLLGAWLFYPRWLAEVIPLANQVYWAYQMPVGEFIGARHRDALVILAIVFFAARYLPAGTQGLVRQLALAAGASFIAFALGKNDWTYHQTPFWVYTWLTCMLFGWGLCRRFIAGSFQYEKRWLPAFLGLVAGIIAGASVVRDYHSWRFYEPEASQVSLDSGVIKLNDKGFAQWAAEHLRGQQIFVGSATIPPFFPNALILEAGWVSRYPHLWPMPAIFRVLAGEDNPALSIADAEVLREQVLADIREDLRKGQADWIFVPREEWRSGNRLDISPFASFILGDRQIAQLLAEGYDYQYDLEIKGRTWQQLAVYRKKQDPQP